MDPAEWMQQFRAAHERFTKGDLNDADKKAYLQMREELARSLLSAQGLMAPDGANARSSFRVAQAFAVEIANVHRTLTRDVSRTGFSALLPASYKEGEQVSFSMQLGRGRDPVEGSARVASVVKSGANARISFSIERLPEAEGERLETALFDSVLARFK